jgi:hypothetical protein
LSPVPLIKVKQPPVFLANGSLQLFHFGIEISLQI